MGSVLTVNGVLSYKSEKTSYRHCTYLNFDAQNCEAVPSSWQIENVLRQT